MYALIRQTVQHGEITECNIEIINSEKKLRCYCLETINDMIEHGGKKILEDNDKKLYKNMIDVLKNKGKTKYTIDELVKMIADIGSVLRDNADFDCDQIDVIAGENLRLIAAENDEEDDEDDDDDDDSDD